MSERGKAAAKSSKKAAPRSLVIAAKGISTGNDFAQLMSSLMSDLIEGRMSPEVGNAVCNAGGKLLKIVEMQYRYGEKQPGGVRRVLELAPLAEAPSVQ